MLLCLGMAVDVAAAHRHEFCPLLKVTNGRQNQFLPTLPYFLTSYTTSHTSLTGSTTSTPASGRSNGSLGSSKLAMQEGRLGDEASTQAVSSTGSALRTKNIKRSASKSKTSFQLAHPPPAVKHRQRFSIRPRLLLQLQQTSDSTRPVPVLDVLPSITFAPRLAKKFPRIFKGKDGLRADDLVVVRSQTYDRSGAPESQVGKSSDDDDWNTRDFVAAFCQMRVGEGAVLGNTEICLNHGPCWEAISMANGAYEFVSTDGEGQKTVARWVPRLLPGRRRSGKIQERSATTSPSGIEKFNFSIINPNFRRHPVIATLTRQSLGICDRYSVPSTPTFPQTSASPSGSLFSDIDAQDVDCDETETPLRTIIETDDHLRTLIVITGLWVAFREGYSPNFKYNDPIFSSVAAARAQQQTQKSHHRRSLSINIGNLANGRAGNSDSGKQKRGAQTRPEIITSSSASVASTLASPTSARETPRRTTSAGTAFMNRVNKRSGSSAVVPSAQSPIGFPSPVPSHEGMNLENLASQPIERNFPFEYPTASPKLRQRHTSMGANKESSHRSSLTTINDLQSSEGSATLMDRNGGKPGRLNRLFGFIRRTSGAHK